MEYEQGEWIIRGVSDNDPKRIKTVDELVERVGEYGFLPLFRNDIPGFSVEEMTVSYHWWSEDPERDPWLWRQIVAESGRAVYGKFFDKKAGFVSLDRFPRFANYRRDGYDFDARWDDGKADIRLKKLTDVFADKDECFSFALKEAAGFGKGGEKNFEGCVTELQMLTYLVIRDFRPRRNKRGEPYGWPIAVYTTPERRWGYDYIAAGYRETPEESYRKLREQIEKLCPGISDRQLKKLLR